MFFESCNERNERMIRPSDPMSTDLNLLDVNSDHIFKDHAFSLHTSLKCIFFE